MIFLGTGAAELIPDPFCSCRVCEYARKSNDFKEKRRRTSTLLDEHNLIDFGPDVSYACATYGVSLAKLKNIFLTHSHADHAAESTLEQIRMSLTPIGEINVYLSKIACEGLSKRYEETLSSLSNNCPKCNLIPLEPYKTYQIDDLTVTPIIGNHNGDFKDETSLNYIFERNGKRILCAWDTGLYGMEQNWETLKGKPLDALIMEGSFGAADKPLTEHHLTFVTIKMMTDKMKEVGAITNKTKMYFTHIAHKGLLTFYEYEKRLKELLGENAILTYDGLDIGEIL